MIIRAMDNFQVERRSEQEPGPARNYSGTLFLIFICWYALLTYGGIRSPDNEISFQTGQELADHGTFAIGGLPTWPGFGIAKGVDGKEYSVFSPLQSVLMVPFISLGEFIDATGWYRHVPFSLPISLQVDFPSFTAALNGSPIVDEAHALRLIVSLFNVLFGALAVVSFYRVLKKFGISPEISFLFALLFGAGSLFQAYAATMFTEPLSTVLVLLSFESLIGISPCTDPKQLFFGGLLLGLALTAHVSVLLFVPFFLFLASFPLFRRVSERTGEFGLRVRPLLFYLGGFLIPAIVLLFFNFMRFGNILETGRTVDPGAIQKFGYGYFVSPWTGLLGVTLSWGKGIVFYSPVIVLACIGWRLFIRREAVAAYAIILMSITRIIFIASRFDWAGGFCLGPRLLVPAIPFLLMPLAFWSDEKIRAGEWGKMRPVLILGAACIIQQWYFSIGEVFTYFHQAYAAGLRAGVNIFHDWRIYFDPQYSPLVHVLQAHRSPFLLQMVPLSNAAIFLGGTVILLAVLFLTWMIVRARLVCRQPADLDHPR